ncbi:MAG TPA: ThuA domain-containing protein [Spirochaetia bacterium]|nr:ThuA domain-containing protein [Spirochaetia bacterium]
MRVRIWNEYRHERHREDVAAVYPEGIHQVIAEHLRNTGNFDVAISTLDEPEHGLTEAALKETDVLFWWGHGAHAEVADEVVRRVQQHVLSGMGLVVLHSAHYSKIFTRLMGTNCSLTWRESGERERIWNLAPGHEITEGIGEYFELPHSEMYGERFDIPEPDKLIFVSWYAGGEVFRSGCAWERGHGRIFYFGPGHETYPIYRDENVLRVLSNVARWARPRITRRTDDSPNRKQPIETGRTE